MSSYIIDLDSLEKKNSVEIYITNRPITLNSDIIDINLIKKAEKQRQPLPFYGKHSTKIIEYCHKDLVYSYDLTNDAQKVIRRHVIQDYVSLQNNKVYCVSYNEETLPIHRFPSTNEISNKDEILRTTYRINNRIYVYHDINESQNKEYIYVRYNHSENIDIKKMQEDIERTIKILLKYSI